MVTEGEGQVFRDLLVEKRQTEDRFQDLFNASPDALFVVDQETQRFLAINDQAIEMYGYSREEWLTMRAPDISAEPTETYRTIRQVPLGCLLRVPLRKHRKKDGTIFYLEMFARSFIWDGRPAAIGSARDITDRLEMETELHKAHTKLERTAQALQRSNAELEQFAYAASHDLREPLNKVKAFGKRLGQRYGHKLDDRGREYIGVMTSAAGRMSLLIDDLLLYSRVSQEQAQPPSPVSLNQVIREALDDLSERVRETQVEIHIDELPEVHGHSRQLRRVFHNLLSNALKFKHPEKPLTIWIRGSVDATLVVVTIKDDGIGFDPQYDEEIFKIFTRLHTRFEYPGTGIGLALCRRILRQYGGDIHATGNPGKGASFTLTIPLRSC